MRSSARGHRLRGAARAAVLIAGIAVPRGTSAALPQVDFDRMGKVGLAGSFAGLDILDSSNAPLDFSTSTLFARAADGSLSRLGSTGSGGKIVAGCTIGDTFYFVGTFDNVAGTTAQNIASYSTANDAFNTVGGGLDGSANAVWCDVQNEVLWVGGSFKAPVGSQGLYSGAVAIYTPKNNSWSAPLFGGLTGGSSQVLSISPSVNGNSLLFSGSFVTAFAFENTTQVASNGTNNPNVPASSGATPFSSSLVPYPLTVQGISANPSSSDSRFSDITKILCPSGGDGPGNTWLGEDGTGAQIAIRQFRYLSSAGIRLGQTFVQGRGTKTFS